MPAAVSGSEKIGSAAVSAAVRRAAVRRYAERERETERESRRGVEGVRRAIFSLPLFSLPPPFGARERGVRKRGERSERRWWQRAAVRKWDERERNTLVWKQE